MNISRAEERHMNINHLYIWYNYRSTAERLMYQLEIETRITTFILQEGELKIRIVSKHVYMQPMQHQK